MQEAFLYKANSLIFSDNWIMILNPIIIRSSAEGTVVYVSRLFLPWPLPTISLRSIIIPRFVLNCHPLFRWLSKLKVTVSIQWSIHCWRTPRRGCRKWIQYLWANHKHQTQLYFWMEIRIILHFTHVIFSDFIQDLLLELDIGIT